MTAKTLLNGTKNVQLTWYQTKPSLQQFPQTIQFYCKNNIEPNHKTTIWSGGITYTLLNILAIKKSKINGYNLITANAQRNCSKID
jgi:hypothetical protein